ncbi:actin-binding protein IPP isoform X2 [Aethina tumida]|uniref:actin-binding protein IPP isoform X2 n=1 Tax=Aethina tumida TaxID=116153 RepID=UPI002147631E|nr:actin-binding protein IPP isoform X2 [Aethina tumida]
MRFLIEFIMPPLKITKNLSEVPKNNNIFTEECDNRTEHTCRSYLSKVVNNLNLLRLNRRFCDVDIVAGDKIFQAHRAVLAASSPYFQAMFTGGLCETDKQSVELHGLSAYIFEILLNFIYSGEVCINQNNVQELMIAADMLELSEVVDGCTEFLMKELHPLNAIGIYKFAEDHNWKQLRNASIDYIEKNFPKICNEDEIYELDKEEFINFLRSENLKIELEYEIFQAAIRWITHNLLERRQYVFEILRHVRLPLISPGLLEKSIAQCTDGSLKIALRSVHSDLLTQKGCLVPLDVKPRKCAKKDIYVIGGSKRELHSVWDRGLEMDYVSIEKFDTLTREWTKVPDMTVNRLVPGVASLNGHIYVVGGEEGPNILKSCERFDPQENQWTSVAPMLVSRCEFGFCALDGYLYAMGGWVDTDMSGSIERYDPKLNEWELYGSLPEPRFSMGLVSYKGLIYMVGGCSMNDRNLKDLMSYNPITGEFKVLPSMSIARFQMGVAVLDDYLYVVGGTNRQDVLSSVERYSFEKNKWYKVPSLKAARSGPAVAAMDGRLYVIGGAKTHATPFYRAQCTIASVECFDPHTNSWSDCPPLSETRAEAGAVVI